MHGRQNSVATVLLLGVLAPSLHSQGTFALDDPTVKTGQVTAGDPHRWVREPIHLGAVPRVRALRGAPTAEETRHASELIERLLEVDRPDAGYSGGLDGTRFLPLSGVDRTSSLVLEPLGLKPDQALLELESMGPLALPALLEHLDDARPTRLSIGPSLFGGTNHRAELGFNPADERESALVEGLLGRPESDRGYAQDETYQVKVADLCFVALGQIVNRSYKAVRYQPSGLIVVSSPVENPGIVSSLRALWRTDDPSQALLERLLIDASTRGAFADELVSGATARLAFYFREETEHWIAARLERIARLAKRMSWSEWWQCEDLGSDGLLRSLSAVDSVPIQLAMVEILKSGPPELLVSACFREGQGAGPDPALSCLLQAIDGLPPEEAVLGRAYDLLLEACTRWPEYDEPIARSFAKASDAHRRHALCLFLQQVNLQGEWIAEILGPWLDDATQLPWQYVERDERMRTVTEGGAVRHEWNEHGEHSRLPLRLCDEAALAIACRDTRFSFELAGSYAALDEQIARIKAGLGR